MSFACVFRHHFFARTDVVICWHAAAALLALSCPSDAIAMPSSTSLVRSCVTIFANVHVPTTTLGSAGVLLPDSDNIFLLFYLLKPSRLSHHRALVYSIISWRGLSWRTHDSRGRLGQDYWGVYGVGTRRKPGPDRAPLLHPTLHGRLRLVDSVWLVVAELSVSAVGMPGRGNFVMAKDA